MANEQNVDLDQDITLEQVKEQLVDIGKKRGVLTYKEIMEKMSFFDQEPQHPAKFSDMGCETGVRKRFLIWEKKSLNENQQPAKTSDHEQDT